ncbi:HNH endonuclease [Arthrobacter sp. MDT2-16]
MRTGAEYRTECERIDARILSLNAEKARIDADMAAATEELRVLLEDQFFDYQSGAESGGESGRQSDQHGTRRRRTNLADTTAATELACLLRISERAAHRLVQYSAVLVNHQTRTLQALREGTISWAHATTVVHECEGLPAGAAALLEDQLLPLAADTTPSRLSARARSLRTRLDPEPLLDRAATAASRRRVDIEPDHDAMVWLHVYLSATDATAIDTRLNLIARTLQTPTEHRTLPQLRADVLTDLLISGDGCPGTTACQSAGAGTGSDTGAGADAGSASTGTCSGAGAGVAAGAGRIRAHVNVTVPVLTLLGVDDAPADLEGYGPIPADIARRLAAHAPSFTRLLTHPETGAVLSVGRTTYSVPADLKTWLRVRDQTCRHPGCTIPASRCELDHTVPWSHGGPTSYDNLAHLCRKHHKLKSEGIWHYTQDPRHALDTGNTPAGHNALGTQDTRDRQPSGRLTAISPTGRVYTSDPVPPPF